MTEFNALSVQQQANVPAEFPSSGANGASLNNHSSYAVTETIPVAGDISRLATVSVDARIIDLFLGWTSFGGGEIDIGFYRIPKDGGEFVNISAFDAGRDITTGSTYIPIRDLLYSFESVNARVWELAGLTERPEYEQLNIVATIGGVPLSTGTFSLKVASTIV
jgi:hypothetical protein